MCDLRDILWDKKIIDFTPEEMVEAGFEGDGVPDSVRELIQQIREDPECYGFITGVMLYCIQSAALDRAREASDPTAQPIDTSKPYGEVSVAPDALTPVGANIVTPFEMANYYYGLFKDVKSLPQLYYRSNMAEAPFPLPKAGDQSFKVPVKSLIPAASDKVLTRKLWGVIAPEVVAALKQRSIRYSAVKLVRFSTSDEATGEDILGPFVIWIATQPGTTNPAQAQEASSEILDVVERHGVPPGVVVEWYEGMIQRLVDVRPSVG